MAAPTICNEHRKKEKGYSQKKNINTFSVYVFAYLHINTHVY